MQKKRKNETCRKECYRYAFPLLQSFCDFYRRQSKMGKASNEGLQIFQNNEDFEFNLKRLFFPSGVEGRDFKSRRVHHCFPVRPCHCSRRRIRRRNSSPLPVVPFGECRERAVPANVPETLLYSLVLEVGNYVVQIVVCRKLPGGSPLIFYMGVGTVFHQKFDDFQSLGLRFPI